MSGNQLLLNSWSVLHSLNVCVFPFSWVCGFIVVSLRRHQHCLFGVCCTAGFSSLRSVYILLAFKMSASLRGSISCHKFFLFAAVYNVKDMRPVTNSTISGTITSDMRLYSTFLAEINQAWSCCCTACPNEQCLFALRVILHRILSDFSLSLQTAQALSEGRRVKRRKGCWLAVKHLHFIIFSEDCVHLSF